MKTSFKTSLVFLLVLALMLAQVTLALAATGVTRRVSLHTSNDSFFPAISADGRYVVFQSLDNTASGGTYGIFDIFVFDTQTNSTWLVSRSPSGDPGNGWSQCPSISADGRYVAFESDASNLVDSGVGGGIFVRDMQSGSTIRVSVDSSGAQENGWSESPSISAGGRFVVFASSSSNLVSGDTNAVEDIFVHDIQTGSTTRVSVDSSGAQGNSTSVYPSISADGRYVAFVSYASNLVSGDTNGKWDVFMHDTQTNTTTQVSVDPDGAPGNYESWWYPAISADGRYVVFASFANNLVDGDTNGAADIFVRDMQTGSTTRVSVDSSGAQGNNSSDYLWHPSISADGRYVVFQSVASNLVSGDTNGKWDVFMHDTQTNTTTQVSVDPGGAPGNKGSGHPFISGDGRYVAFQSAASNLVSGDTNSADDIFVRDMQPPVDTSMPTVDAFTAASFSTSLDIPITSFTASDNVAVTGYMISESASAPTAEAAGWSPVAPTSYAVPGDGSHTLYPWAKDASGNISAVFAAPALVVVDTVAPSVDSFAAPTSSASLDIPITAFSASDNVGVSAYLVTASALFPGPGMPDVGDAGWSATAPTSYVVPGDGSYRLYPWVKDKAGNISPIFAAPVLVVVNTIPPSSLTTTRVSLDSSGAQGNWGTEYPSISAEGRYVVFVSGASNLVSGDTNGISDVFLRDRKTGSTTRVSVSSNGEQGNDWSEHPSISADGRYVAFESGASNLVSGDTNGMPDIFVYDTQTNSTTRISLSSSGVQGNGRSDFASISADGRYVAFESVASNLVDGGASGGVFVHDMQLGSTIRISVDSSGAQRNATSYCHCPAISTDGRYVAFVSNASNLVSGDTNGAQDIFVRDIQTSSTTRVSVDSSGAQGNADSYRPAISADGHYVAFESDASNLVSGDTNGATDIFIHDTQTNTTVLVSVSSSGAQGNSWLSFPSISADGRYVAFESGDNNLVSGDTNGDGDIFMRDIQTGNTIRVSVDSSGAQGNGWSLSPSISADGRYVAFVSGASNLVSGDTNSADDIFVRDTQDVVAPTVLSSTLASPNPSHAASVDFTVTFSEAVIGVDMLGPSFNDFSLVSSAGISDAAITGVSGSGAVYTVTVNTGTGNGTLRLDVVSGGGIQDGAGNPLAAGFSGGEVYNVVKTVNISGNTGPGGVTLSYNDGSPKTVTSVADGSYSLSVPYGWAGTLTPFKAAYMFTPASRSYTAAPVTADLSGQDFGATPHVVDDFNGDGKTDLAVFRKSTGYWFVRYADGSSTNKQWGNAAAGDIPQLGDFNGDGKTDYAVWRPSNGTWYVKYADDTSYSQQWGNLAAGDIPVPGDYNGDGKTDIAVWRPTNGTWYIHYMDGTSASQQWGNSAAGDVPVPADYNGDGVTEFAVFRKSTGFWYIRYAGGTTQSRQWGNAAAGDVPMPGDYNGDGLTEIAVWRPTTGFWYVKYADDTSSSQQWGNYASGDMPVCGDFNGDGKSDYAVWRPANGAWYVRYADGSTYTQQWGNLGAGDLPLPRR